VTFDPKVPVTERATLYHMVDKKFVDIERRNGALWVRTGTLNGKSRVQEDPSTNIDDVVTYYHAKGFRRGSPWGFGRFGIASRQFIKPPIWACVSVHRNELRTSGGTSWHSNYKAERCASEAEAIAKAEALIAEREADGYVQHNFELLEVESDDVDIEYTPTGSPHDAVDRAVTMLRDLARDFAFGHFLVEDVTRDAKILTSLGYGTDNGHGKFFQEMHSEKFARWAMPSDAPRTGSSYDYFLKRWGTLTWIVSGELDEGLPMFYSGNVSGGGWCALELGHDLGDATMYADERPGHGYDQALCFHGGWGRTGYIFDRRVASPTGEWAIYPLCLDGPQDDDPPADDALPDPASIEPFGFWLERNVLSMIATLRPRLETIA
jgi:hypothetical protein